MNETAPLLQENLDDVKSSDPLVPKATYHDSNKMNSITRQDLQAFITAVETLAHAVSSVAGTDALEEVYETAERLKDQLDCDATIV